MKPQYIHSSMYGSYHIDCEILKEYKHKLRIKYTDPVLNEEITKNVDKEIVKRGKR